MVKDDAASAGFPYVLAGILDVEPPDVITWSSSGRAFGIRSMNLFKTSVLPRHFKHDKFSSFQRQLNLYGFRKLVRGREAGCYFHPSFQRGERRLLKQVKRGVVPACPAHYERKIYGCGARPGGGGSEESSDSEPEMTPLPRNSSQNTERQRSQSALQAAAAKKAAAAAAAAAAAVSAAARRAKEESTSSSSGGSSESDATVERRRINANSRVNKLFPGRSHANSIEVEGTVRAPQHGSLGSQLPYGPSAYLQQQTLTDNATVSSIPASSMGSFSSGSVSDSRDSLSSAQALFSAPLWLDDDPEAIAAAAAAAAGHEQQPSAMAVTPALPFAQRRDSLCRNSFCAMLATLENELLVDDQFLTADADAAEVLPELQPQYSSSLGDLALRAENADAGAVAAAAAAVAVNHTATSGSDADAAHDAALDHLELFDRPGFSSTLIDFAYEMQDLLGDEEDAHTSQQHQDRLGAVFDEMQGVTQSPRAQQQLPLGFSSAAVSRRRSSLSELVMYADNALTQHSGLFSSELDNQHEQQQPVSAVISDENLLDLGERASQWPPTAPASRASREGSTPSLQQLLEQSSTLNASALSNLEDTTSAPVAAAGASAAGDSGINLSDSSRKRIRDFDEGSDLQQPARGGITGAELGAHWASANGGASRAQLRSSIMSALSSLSAECDDMSVACPEEQLQQMQLIDSDDGAVPAAADADASGEQLLAQGSAQQQQQQQQQQHRQSIPSAASQSAAAKLRSSRRWSTMTEWMDGYYLDDAIRDLERSWEMAPHAAPAAGDATFFGSSSIASSAAAAAGGRRSTLSQQLQASPHHAKLRGSVYVLLNVLANADHEMAAAAAAAASKAGSSGPVDHTSGAYRSSGCAY